MIIYRKRLLMEDRTTNEPADIFHFNEGFLRRTLCSSHQDQQAPRARGGGRFRPRGRPSGGIWYLTQKNSSCSQRNNSSSRSKGTDCDSWCHGGGEGWLLLLAEKGCETPFMSVVGGTFQFFLNEPPLHRWTPPLSDPR